jgi:CheY-like chemotaxis protein
MMPKISGFDMLDILRSTPETTNAKVIMMTALSQAEDKTRASQLGADRYLVKSQVTLEDVVATAHELLEGVASAAPAAVQESETAAAAPTEAPAESQAAETAPEPAPAAEASAESSPPQPIEVKEAPAEAESPAPAAPVAEASPEATPASDQSAAVESQIQDFISSQQTNVTAATPDPASVSTPEPTQPAAPAAPAGSAGTQADDTSASPLIPDISPDSSSAGAPVAAPAADPVAAPAEEKDDNSHGVTLQPLGTSSEEPKTDLTQPLTEADTNTEMPSQSPGEVIEPTAPSQDAASQNPPVLS